MEEVKERIEIDLYLEQQISKTSLDELFSFSFHYEKFKYLLELIIRQQREHSRNIKYFNSKVEVIEKFSFDIPKFSVLIIFVYNIFNRSNFKI